MRIRAISEYGPGAPSVRARVSRWLERLGVSYQQFDYLGAGSSGPSQLLKQPLRVMAAERELRREAATAADVTLVHRSASPFPTGIETRLLAGPGRGVLDFDDALQWDWRSHPGGWLRRPHPFLRAVQVADTVIAGNEFLAEWAQRWARDVVVIPTCIEPSDYVPKMDYEIADPPRIGWIGTPSTERYLRMIEAPLLEVHRKTGAQLILISAGNRALGALDYMTRRLPWSVEVQRDLGSLIDIGIMPLYDSLWTRGKCGYKLLQYATAGVPAVASQVGVAPAMACSLGHQAVAEGSEWRDALLHELQRPADARERTAFASREAIVRSFSYDAWEDPWRDAVLRPSRHRASTQEVGRGPTAEAVAL